MFCCGLRKTGVSSRGGRPRAAQWRRLAVEGLEPRRLLAYSFTTPIEFDPGGGLTIEPDPIGVSLPVPALESHPGAPVTLYLNFSGYERDIWDACNSPPSHPGRTPPFSLDSNPAFSLDEIREMTRIWAHVAEDYAPFDVNVTTIPHQPKRNEVLQVVLGGAIEDWFNQPYAAVSSPGNFICDEHPTEYVFTETIYADFGHGAKEVADAASHEAGHGFGLAHQSSYVPLPVGEVTLYALVHDYNPSDGVTGPIMGDGWKNQRTTWWVGQRGSGSLLDHPPPQQDDMAILQAALGLRADDHQDFGSGQATELGHLSSHNARLGRGIIGQTSDSDAFSFDYVGGGRLTISLSVFDNIPLLLTTLDVPGAANLDATLRLYDSGGQLIAQSDPSGRLDAEIEVVGLPGGTYQLVVGSHGAQVGDVGQYYFIARSEAPQVFQHNVHILRHVARTFFADASDLARTLPLPNRRLPVHEVPGRANQLRLLPEVAISQPAPRSVAADFAIANLTGRSARGLSLELDDGLEDVDAAAVDEVMSELGASLLLSDASSIPARGRARG